MSNKADPCTWTVVQFLKDKSVEAVPSSWIIGDLCYWPTYTPDKVTKAIQKGDEVNTHWPSHPVKIFRNATFGMSVCLNFIN